MSKSIQTIITFMAVALCAAFLTGCSAKARMARHQDRADKYFAAGDYSKAEVEYLIALRLSEGNAHAISRLGDIYYEQGRFRRAYSFLAKACELVTNDLNLHVKLGTIYLIGHMPKEAREQAEFVLDRSPTNAEAPDILAESIASRAELDQVRARLEKLSKQIGDTAALELAFAVMDFTAGNIKASETALQRSLTLDPKNSSAYHTLGNLYLSQNKLKEADAAFKTAADLSPVRSPKRLSYANFKIQTGDLAEGKRLMAEITKEAPDYLPAWLREAEIALDEKKYDDCDALINQALTKDPDNYDGLMLRGRLLLTEGKADKAVAEMDRMSALYDRSPEVQYLLAVAHLGVNDPTKASSDLTKALFLRPMYPEATVVLAQINIKRGDTVSAINSLSALVRQLPNSPDAYLLLANAYFAQKNFDQALSAYTRLSEILPKNPEFPLLIGMVLVQKNNKVEARKSFERALELSPQFVLALEQLINLDLAANQFSEALDRVSKATNAPDWGREVLVAKIHIAKATYLANGEAKIGSGEAKLNIPTAQDDVNQAEAALQKAIELAPTQDTPQIMLANLYLSTGREQVALDRLNGVVNKTNNPVVYLQIGTIYEALKDYPKARDAYEKVLASRPDSVGALNNLSYVYAEHLGEIEKAYTLAQKARQLSPGDPSTADTLGWILYKKGDYTRARGLLEESASKMTEQPEVQYHLGMVRYMLDDETPARAALQEAVSSPQAFSGKDDAVRRLAVLSMDVSTADAKTRADLEKRLQDEPGDPVVVSRLGAIYERDGTLDKAANLYEQSIKQNPQNPAIMSRLARVYINLNQPDKALEVAKDAHKLAPDDAVTSCMLGRLAFQTGDYTWAANLLQEAAPKLSKRPDVQYDLAWAYYAVGRVSDAEKTMQGAAAALTTTRLADAKQFLAMVSAAKTPTAAAATQAAQILSTNSNYVPAIMVSAVQADQQGNSDDAGKLYERVLARYPAFAPAARNLTIFYAQHPGDDQKAYEMGVKIRGIYPDDIQLERALGVLAYRRGDFPRAAQLLKDGSQTLTSDGELFYYLGMAQYQLKQTPQAKASLQRALMLKIQAKPADDARKILAELK
jgi:tetratricopeptide (TPR) repeat protein